MVFMVLNCPVHGIHGGGSRAFPLYYMQAPTVPMVSMVLAPTHGLRGLDHVHMFALQTSPPPRYSRY
jgi:hypothetical protein